MSPLKHVYMPSFPIHTDLVLQSSNPCSMMIPQDQRIFRDYSPSPLSARTIYLTSSFIDSHTSPRHLFREIHHDLSLSFGIGAFSFGVRRYSYQRFHNVTEQRPFSPVWFTVGLLRLPSVSLSLPFHHFMLNVWPNALAVYFYDYFLTFDREVELFWKRKFTGASMIFYLNRYTTIVQFILLLLQDNTVLRPTVLACLWSACLISLC